MRETLMRAAATAQIIAAVLLALAALRFAGYSVVRVIRQQAGEAGAVSTAPVASGSAPAASGPVQIAQPVVEPRGPDAGPAPGTPVRPTLVVSGDAERADVRVEGRVVGRTPFLGEVSCKLGQTVRIQVVPRTGPAKSYRAVCAVGTIRIQ